MHVAGRLAPTARALRLFSVCIAFAVLVSLVLVGCYRKLGRVAGKPWPQGPNEEMTARTAPRDAFMSNSVHSREDFSEEPGLEEIDAETTNLTIVLENMEIDTRSDEAPWMFASDGPPFIHGNHSAFMYANTRLSWNSDGRGNGTCSSGGSGKPSRGYIDPYNNFLGIDAPRSFFEEVQIEMRNLSLVDFLHVNTANPDSAWDVMGQAGDMRTYKHGSFKAFRGNKTLLFAKNVEWTQNLSYPEPVGEALEGTYAISGYFVGKIQSLLSDETWVQRLDPNGAGYLLGVLMAASFGEPSCFTSNSYWVSLRGFPKFKREKRESAAGEFVGTGDEPGAKAGVYKGSSEAHISSARFMSGTAKTVTTAVVGGAVSGAVSSTMATVLFPGPSATPPGQGLVRLLNTAVFVARLNEIRGFHTDAMAEFGKGLQLFLGKVEWPLSQNSGVSSSGLNKTLRYIERSIGRVFPNSNVSTPLAQVQQEQSSEVSVSDELFGGCAFYTTLIVVGYLALHGCVWLILRKKPLEQQLLPHAWMIYIFSVVMSHVYRAAVLNSMQYLRSHVGKGTGRPGFYFVAVVQLLLIGVGFTVFFMTIMILALKRVLRDEVKWIPKEELADPDMRRSAVIMGEYKGDNNTFHSLFECYYSSLMGPRVWLAGLELIIAFLDILCTALIWNEVVCLAVLVCAYAVLFCLFFVLSPFVDRIEGWFVSLLGGVELVLLVLEFIGAVGDYDTAEDMEYAALILGFVAIGIAVLIGVYCDFIPIVFALWSKFKQQFLNELVLPARRGRNEGSEVDSDWSKITSSSSQYARSENWSVFRMPAISEDTTQVDALVAHNADQEEEVRHQLTSMLRDRITPNQNGSDEQSTVVSGSSADITESTTEEEEDIRRQRTVHFSSAVEEGKGRSSKNWRLFNS